MCEIKRVHLICVMQIQTTQIMGSIQLGIQHAVGGLASKPERDLLMQDFMTVETTNFPSEGSNHTPAHHFSEFKFKNYAPIAFRYFRDLFGIQPDDFLVRQVGNLSRSTINIDRALTKFINLRCRCVAHHCANYQILVLVGVSFI